MCDRILDAAPQDPAAHQLAATIALRRGRLGEAARWANSSLSLRPDHSPTLIVAARVARAAGDLAQARTWLERAARLAPDRPEPAFLACVTLIELGDEKARSVLEDLLLRFPNFVDGWREIGEALRKAGQPKTAVLAFARAAEVFGRSDGSRAIGRGAADARPPARGHRRFSKSARGRARSCRSESSAWSVLASDGRSATGPRRARTSASFSAERWPRLVRARTGLRRPARHAGRDSRPIAAASRRSRTFLKPTSTWDSICKTRVISTPRWLLIDARCVSGPIHSVASPKR